MADDHSSSRSSRASILLAIDDVCEKFEGAWLAGQRPEVARFLEMMPEKHRGRLLQDLIPSDVDFRRKAGEQPSREEYAQRFPQFAANVEAAFADLDEPTAQAAEPAVPTSSPSLGLDAVKTFFKGLFDSGLMSRQDIEKFWNKLPADQRPQDADSLSNTLIKQGKLTPYQAERIRNNDLANLLIDDYEVLDQIGEGGMGAVLKARHRRMRRVVALKIINQKALQSPEALNRFQQEVLAAGQLSHPNIVTAFDAREKDGLHYFVMEYVEGQDLASLISDRQRIPADEAVDYVLQAAEGLRYAHSRQIIHRDIKPANLLLSTEGQIKILDMGLATLGEAAEGDGTQFERLTQSGQIMGTVDYMAPEQALDTREADARSDIYALGCTLYRLITGKRMYEADTMMKTVMAHANSPIPSLRSEQPEVSEQLEEVFQRMVAKAPENRQQSMEQVIEQLTACRRGLILPTATTGEDDASHRKPPVAKPAAPKSPDDSSISAGTSPFVSGQDAARNKALPEFTVNAGRQATATKVKPKRAKEVVATADTIAGQATEDTVRHVSPLVKLTRPPYRTYSVIGGGLLGVLAVVSGILLTINTPDGTLVIESDDPNVEVQVTQGGEQVAIVDKDQGWSIKLEDGEYQVAMVGGGEQFHLDKDTVTVNRGEKQLVRVTKSALAELPKPGEIGKTSPTPPGPIEENTAERIAEFPMEGRSTQGKISSDSKIVVASNDRGAIHLFDLELPQTSRVLKEPSDVRWESTFSSDGRRLSLAGSGGELEIYETKTGKLVCRIDTRLEKQIPRVAWVANKDQIVVPVGKGGVGFFSATTGELLEQRGSDWAVVGPIAVLETADRVAFVCQDQTIRVRSLERDKPIATLTAGDELPSLAFEEEDRLIGGTRVWHIGKSDQPVSYPGRFASPGLRWTATPLGNNGSVGILNTATRKERQIQASTVKVHAVAFSADGNLLATGDHRGNIRLWDPADGRKLGDVPGHAGWINSLDFSRDGRLLVSTSWDGRVGVSRLHVGKSEPKAEYIPEATTVRFINSKSNLCLAVFGDSTKQGQRMSQEPEAEDDLAQQWKIEDAGDGCVRLKNLNSGLHLANDDPRQGERVTQRTLDPAAKMFLWRIEKIDDEHIKILSEVNGLCLAIWGGDTKAGQYVIQWQYKGGGDQRWKIVPMEGGAGEPVPLHSFQPTAEQRTFLEQVATLPAQEQIDAVSAKLIEVHGDAPEDVRSSGKVVDGKATSFWVDSRYLRELWPVRALSNLRELSCAMGGSNHGGQLTDLSPLAGMQLTKLECYNNFGLKDLSPLAGMPLEHLDCYKTGVGDLSPLAGMPLKYFKCGYRSGVKDLSPLSGAPLTYLYCGNTQVDDLSAMKGAPLETLVCHETSISDLAPLAGAPLRHLNCSQTKVADLTPLKGAPLGELFFRDTEVADLAPLLGMHLTTLDCANTHVSDISPLADMPLETLDCTGTALTDLSPVATLDQIRVLYCQGAPVRDFAPLTGLPLERVDLPVRLFHEADERVLKTGLTRHVRWGAGELKHSQTGDLYWSKISERRQQLEEFVQATAKLPTNEQIGLMIKELNALSEEPVRFQPQLEGDKLVAVDLGLPSNVAHVSPLRALQHLKKLSIEGGSPALDLSALNNLALEEVNCSDLQLRYNAAMLRLIPALKTINGKPASEVLASESQESKTTSATRTWNDKSGEFAVEAELVEVHGESARLRRTQDGKTIEVPVASLSEADQAIIQAWQASRSPQ